MIRLLIVPLIVVVSVATVYTCTHNPLHPTPVIIPEPAPSAPSPEPVPEPIPAPFPPEPSPPPAPISKPKPHHKHHYHVHHWGDNIANELNLTEKLILQRRNHDASR